LVLKALNFLFAGKYACHLFLFDMIYADLSAEFAKDVQEFVKVKYNSGQAMLQDCRSSKGSSANQLTLNPLALLTQSLVSCIEVLRWTIREEHG